MTCADPIQRLIRELCRLPGVGERSGGRLAYHIIKASCGPDAPTRLAADLAAALTEVSARVGACARCRNFATDDLCVICADPRRDRSLLCVVEQVGDVRAIEATGAYRGVYHVLHGALAPLEGVGPEELRLDLVRQRAQEDGVCEVIVATNPTVDGDATALYLARSLASLGRAVTRLASGVPLGGELEYLDAATLERALAQRRSFA